MSQRVNLLVDIQNRRLVRGFYENITTQLPNFVKGETVSLFVRFVQPTGSAEIPFTDVDYTGGACKVGIGVIASTPTSGTFKLTYGADTTAVISYAATGAQVAAALNLIASIIAAGGVTGTGSAGGPWDITFVTAGVTTAITGSSFSLSPISNVIVDDVQDGATNFVSIQRIALLQNPLCYQDTFTAFAAPTVSIAKLQTGSASQNDIQSVTVGNEPYSGSFALNWNGFTSNLIAWNATASDVQAALEAITGIGVGQVNVQGLQAGPWQVTFTGTLALAAQANMTSVATGLIGPKALVADLSLNTGSLIEALGTSTSLTDTIEVQITPSGGSLFVPYQGSITILNKLINGSPAIPTPTTTYYTAAQTLALDEGTPSASGESGKTALGNGVNTKSVSFAVTKTNNAWHFRGLIIKNTVDGSPLTILPGIVTARSTTGFTITLTGTTDSANYVLEWDVILDP